MLLALLLLLLLVAAFFYPPPPPGNAPVNRLYLALTALCSGMFPTGTSTTVNQGQLPGAMPPLLPGGFGYPRPNIFAMGARPLNHSSSPLKTHRHCRTIKRSKR